MALVLGMALTANGLVMLGVPDAWYASVPGVPQTGPFNPHFVRDIGAAYLVSGAALAWFAFDRAARAAAIAAAAFLTLHALIHLWDATAGQERAHRLLADLPTVFLPAALAIWIVLAKKEKDNAQMVLRRWIDKFERTWNYDASYMREVLEADPRALMAFSKVQASPIIARMYRFPPIARPPSSAP